MSVYAIIETGGKQLRVEPGRFYDVERLAVEEGGSITIDQVLFVQDDGDVHVGQPLVAGATVEGTVMRHMRGRKIIVYKMKPKKKTRKKQGHRQELTRLMIDAIAVGGKALGAVAVAQASSEELEAKSVEAEVVE
jgi:large subunit ribosomal protein L21